MVDVNNMLYDSVAAQTHLAASHNHSRCNAAALGSHAEQSVVPTFREGREGQGLNPTGEKYNHPSIYDTTVLCRREHAKSPTKLASSGKLKPKRNQNRKQAPGKNRTASECRQRSEVRVNIWYDEVRENIKQILFRVFGCASDNPTSRFLVVAVF